MPGVLQNERKRWSFPLLTILRNLFGREARVGYSIKDHSTDPKYTYGTIKKSSEEILLIPSRKQVIDGMQMIVGRIYLYPAYDVKFDIILMKNNIPLTTVPAKANKGWKFDVHIGTYNGYAAESIVTSNSVIGFEAGKYFEYTYGYMMVHGYSPEISGLSNDTLYSIYSKYNNVDGVGNVREQKKIAFIGEVPDSITIRQTKPLIEGQIVIPYLVKELPPTKPFPLPPPIS